MKKISLLFSYKVILVLLIVFQFTQIFFFHQSSFSQKYDVEYWRDRYDHSQYILPLSRRVIGDDAFYTYSGYRIVTGTDPVSIHFDKPLAGIYMIGLSVLIFSSPAYLAFMLGIAAIVIFYVLARGILSEPFALLATVLLSFDPLFLRQLWTPWLDLPQLLFLLINILFLKVGVERKNFLLISISGIALGLFAMTKPPVLFFPIFTFEIIFLFLKKFKLRKKIISLTLFSLFTGIGIFTPTLPLFVHGHSLPDVIRIHKYMLNYYLSSQVEFSHIAIWESLFFGKFAAHNTFEIKKVAEWSMLWPLTAILAFPYSIYIFKSKNNKFLKLISGIVFIAMITYTFIPSFPRYLLTIIPSTYILALGFVSRTTKKIPNRYLLVFALPFLIYGAVNSHLFLRPDPNTTISRFTESYSGMFFQDIHKELLTQDTKKKITRSEFHQFGLRAFSEAGIENVEIDINKIQAKDNQILITADFFYRTRDLGEFKEEKKIKLTKENEEWKINWTWDLLLSNFSPGYKIEKQIVPGKRGSILNSSGKVLVEDDNSFLISINPSQLDKTREQEILHKVSEITDLKEVHIQNRYNENPLKGAYVDIATIFNPFYLDSIFDIEEKGVKITPHISRLYFDKINLEEVENTTYYECCSRIYSSTNYHGTTGVEKKFDKKLSGENGGKILLLDSKGNIVRTLIEKEARNGDNITLDE